jgi:catalase
VSSVPFSLTTISGSARSKVSRSSSRTTRTPPNDTSTTVARHSRLKSSTMHRIRNRRPSLRYDGVPNARALAVKFQLPDGKNADILALHIEGFPARTPEEFLAFLRAQLLDPATGEPARDAVPRFLDSHPTTRAFIERLMQKPVPAGYGRASYYAEHAFKFTGADGASRFGRYRWMPEAGEAYLSPDDASTRSTNFLREELEGRLSNGSVAFRLLLQLAREGEPTDDVTAL